MSTLTNMVGNVSTPKRKDCQKHKISENINKNNKSQNDITEGIFHKAQKEHKNPNISQATSSYDKTSNFLSHLNVA